MKAASWGGRVALRSMGKLLIDQYRPCRVLCQPQGHHRRLMTHSNCRVMEFWNGKWGQGLLMQRMLPTTTSWGRQLQQEHGFLSIGDGDEDGGLSKHFEEDRVFGYTPEQVYDVVAGVDLYEEFVPWCLKSKVLLRKDNEMEAELEIGYKMFVERYISHVELKPPSLIKSTVSESALFDFLNNEWHFKPGPTPESCRLHFTVDFQFKSPLYRQVAHLFFNEVQARLVDSFDNRCKVVYGPNSKSAMRKKKKSNVSYLTFQGWKHNVFYSMWVKELHFDRDSQRLEYIDFRHIGSQIWLRSLSSRTARTCSLLMAQNFF